MLDPWHGDPAGEERAKRRRIFLRTWGLVLAAAVVAAAAVPRILRWAAPPGASSGAAARSGGSREGIEVGRGVKVEAGIEKRYRFIQDGDTVRIVVEEVRPVPPPDLPPDLIGPPEPPR